MKKSEFLKKLEAGLAGLPREDIDERLAFYSEMIDDRMEEGLTEDAAVDAAGPVDAIVSQIVAEVPLSKIVKENLTPRRSRRGWEIALIVLGFPLWFPLIVAAAVIVFAMYVVLWSLVIAIWAVEVALCAASVGFIVTGVVYALRGEIYAFIAAVGAGFICAGLSIFLFFGCVAASKGVAVLSRKIGLGIKRLFIRKDRSK